MLINLFYVIKMLTGQNSDCICLGVFVILVDFFLIMKSDYQDFKSEIRLVHLEKLLSKSFSAGQTASVKL